MVLLVWDSPVRFACVRLTPFARLVRLQKHFACVRSSHGVLAAYWSFIGIHRHSSAFIVSICQGHPLCARPSHQAPGDSRLRTIQLRIIQLELTWFKYQRDEAKKCSRELFAKSSCLAKNACKRLLSRQLIGVSPRNSFADMLRVRRVLFDSNFQPNWT